MPDQGGTAVRRPSGSIFAGIAMLAVVVPSLTIAAIVLLHVWKPLSSPDRALFAVGLIAAAVCALASVKTRHDRSWKRFILDCGPPALLIYPFTHSLILVSIVLTPSVVTLLIRSLGAK